MRMLLDTHVVVWWLAADPHMSAEAMELIDDGSNDVYVSAVSAVEIATKVAIGKLDVPGDLPEQIKSNFIRELPVSIEHGLEVGRLPLHHRDPFDRLLVAQARYEGLTLITADKKLGAYDVRLLSAS